MHHLRFSSANNVLVRGSPSPLTDANPHFAQVPSTPMLENNVTG